MQLGEHKELLKKKKKKNRLLNLTNPKLLNSSVYNLEVSIICLAHKKWSVNHTKMYTPERNEERGVLRNLIQAVGLMPKYMRTLDSETGKNSGSSWECKNLLISDLWSSGLL